MSFNQKYLAISMNLWINLESQVIKRKIGVRFLPLLFFQYILSYICLGNYVHKYILYFEHECYFMKDFAQCNQFSTQSGAKVSMKLPINFTYLKFDEKFCKILIFYNDLKNLILLIINATS